jgi:hypothetical protein
MIKNGTSSAINHFEDAFLCLCGKGCFLGESFDGISEIERHSLYCIKKYICFLSILSLCFLYNFKANERILMVCVNLSLSFSLLF